MLYVTLPHIIQHSDEVCFWDNKAAKLRSVSTGADLTMSHTISLSIKALLSANHSRISF